LPNLKGNCDHHTQPISIRYGVVANISRSHNLREKYRGAQGSIPCTGVEETFFLLFDAVYVEKASICILFESNERENGWLEGRHGGTVDQFVFGVPNLMKVMKRFMDN
jgi:hypothetical protein